MPPRSSSQLDQSEEKSSDFLRAMCTWGSLRLFLNRRQTFYLLGNFATGADQIQDQPLINIEGAFVLVPIPHIVALRQDSPDFRPQGQSIRQHLKNDVPFRRSESVVPERRQTQCVSGAVGEIELLSSELASFSASFSRARPERTSPANSFASGASFARTFPGPARRSSGRQRLQAVT